jgi:hypothetical protein
LKDVRIIAKLVWMTVLLLLLITFARSDVDFVYRGF